MRRAAWLFLALAACAAGEEAPRGGDGTGAAGSGAGGAAGGGSGGGGGGGGQEPMVAPSMHFVVEGAGLDHETTWAPPANLVECQGKTGLVLRFAADPNPQTHPEQLELQVFGYTGPGSYEGADCVGAGCPPQPPKTFALSYVPPDSMALYRNGAPAEPCTLDLVEPAAGALGGSWVCENVSDVVASGQPITLSGDFTCAL